MRPSIIVSLFATAFLSISGHAQDARSASTDKAKWLSIPEVHAKLESAGYRNIEKIERERGSYEVKATDPTGRRIKLYVHPQTGEVTGQRQRDAKRDQYGGGERGLASSNQRNPADCNARRCRDDVPQQGSAQPAPGK